MLGENHMNTKHWKKNNEKKTHNSSVDTRMQKLFIPHEDQKLAFSFYHKKQITKKRKI